jgi:hypothetical protein
MTVVFSVIFPSNLPYFYDFIKSLECQSSKNFKLILINDGVINLDDYLKNTSIKHETHFVNKLTPFQIRIFGLNLLLKMKPHFIIFADTDDKFSFNRVEVLVQNLEKYSFVCNDIDLITDQGVLIENSVWEKRLGDNFEFDIQFIKNKNIIGLGNSGMQFCFLEKILDKVKNFAVGNDWLFFSTAENELKGLFVTSCTTHYRQHMNNLIGKKSINLNDLLKIINVKINHYNLLDKINFKCYDVEQELKSNKNLHQLVCNDLDNIEKQILKINSLNTSFFWWEETNFLNY